MVTLTGGAVPEWYGRLGLRGDGRDGGGQMRVGHEVLDGRASYEGPGLQRFGVSRYSQYPGA